MKHLLFILICLLTLVTAKAQSVSILFDAGLLENTTGTAVIPAGALCQIIASPSGVFSDPTSASYVSGDNILLQSFAMNYNSGIAGETLDGLFSLPLSTSSYTLTTGEQLELRFYSNLTYASMPSAPTLLTTFGQVRSSTIEFGPSGGDSSETPWVVPSAGSSVDMDYITVNDGGTYANVTADATRVVLAAAPEPATYALLVWGVVAVLCLKAGKRFRSFC